MKKIFYTFTIISYLLFMGINYSYGYYYCPNHKDSYESYKEQAEIYKQKWLNSSRPGSDRDSYYSSYISYQAKYEQGYDDYLSCLDEATSVFNKGYSSFEKNDYNNAIKYYKDYLNYTSKNDENYAIARSNIQAAYSNLALTSFNKDEYAIAIDNWKKALEYNDNYGRNYSLNYHIAISYYNLIDYNNANMYLDRAYEYATLKDEINQVNSLRDKIQNTKDVENLIKNAPTNDTYSGLQYYLKQLNIPKAWGKVKNNNKVIVAIIDDGINTNNPDLVDSIWIDPSAKYGDSKVIDFVGDGMPANLPIGDHGTMVAGIIGAKQNNNEGIAGIAKNVKLMPLRVFESDGNGGSLAYPKNTIDAINYAIDNGADIINLSLGGSQFAYLKDYDSTIKRAYDKGIIVVIAAGNGDVLSNGNNGVNLTNNPISPVCNNEGKNRYSIGVYATDRDGNKTNWTNYGDCADFSAPGVEIISTSIPIYNSNYGNNYSVRDGTSFSAPIISGIIALGYNEYGPVGPEIVYSALDESKKKNGEVDAAKYIDVLGSKIKDEQAKIKNEEKQKQKVEVAFKELKNYLSKKQENYRNKTYSSLLKKLESFEGKLKGDKEIVLNHLIYLINKEL